MTRNRSMPQHMPLHSDAGYQTAADEFVAMHDAFLDSQEKFAENVKASLIVCKAIAQLPTSKGGGGCLIQILSLENTPTLFPIPVVVFSLVFRINLFRECGLVFRIKLFRKSVV